MDFVIDDQSPVVVVKEGQVRKFAFLVRAARSILSSLSKLDFRFGPSMALQMAETISALRAGISLQTILARVRRVLTGGCDFW